MIQMNLILEENHIVFFYYRFISSEDGMVLQRQWQEVANDVQEYIDKVVTEWRSVASADYTPALSQPLLQRRHDSTIAVNFSAEVTWSLLSVFADTFLP